MKGQHRLDLIVAYLKNHTLVTVEQLVEAVDASPALTSDAATRAIARFSAGDRSCFSLVVGWAGSKRRSATPP